MRKIRILSSIQGAPEVRNLGEIEEPGIYVVAGFSRPVSVTSVTPYGEEALRERGYRRFFTGADGRRYSAIMAGEFA